MKFVEKFVSPLVKEQFPGFYQEEGPKFIAFVKAYYEWLENNFQELIFENDTDFNIGDEIKQANREGRIITKYGHRYLVEVITEEKFKCNRLCNDLNVAFSSSGGESLILQQRSFNVEYLARRLPEFRDIDSTIEDFIIQFKNKYLPDIQFTTASNKQLFIKNSLDFYRAKGTERAVDLFFKLIYGFEAKVYLPSEDIFKPSDNEWVNVAYLEVEESPKNVQFVGQIIFGAVTNAKAFVERLVRVRKGARYISVLYLANLEGNFNTGETVYTVDLENNVTTRILGSLSAFEIVSSQSNFIVGETVIVSDGAGKSAKARVTSIVDRVGTVDFELLQGGWGYSENAEILGSQRVFRFSNLVVENDKYIQYNDPFIQFETIKQDLITFETDSLLPNNSIVFGYSNTEQTFTGLVVGSDELLSTLIVNYNEATTNTTLLLTTDTLYTTANVLSTNILSINTNSSATANVIASSAQSTFSYTSSSPSSFIVEGSVIFQQTDDSQIIANAVVTRVFSNTVTNENFIEIERDTGMFRSNLPFRNSLNNDTYTINSISNTEIGVIGITNTFYNNANTYGVTSGSHSPAVSLSFTTEATFDIFSLNNRQQFLNFFSTDIISSVPGNTVIDDTSYGLSANSSLGFNDIIGEATEFSNVELGSIESIIVRNPGSGYPTDPFFIVFERSAYHLERYDFQINYLETQRSFLIGETIVGQTSGARGVITRHSRTDRFMLATRISLDENWSTSNDFFNGEIISGLNSSSSATITSVSETRRKPRTGLNARIKSEALDGVGFAASLEVIDSGFGYFDDEFLTLITPDKSQRRIAVIAKLGKQGIGEGYHSSTKSFLSSNKYIQDSDFYQEYSYEILTSLPFEVYRKTLIDVLHVAGTKPFGSYSSTSEESLTINAESEFEQFEDE